MNKMSEKKKGEKILVVDDSADTLELVERNLSEKGYTVLSVSTPSDAVAILEREPIDLVITDYKMPKVSGLDLVRYVRENFRATEAMMITGYATIEGAVEAVKAGAEEYLAKPFTEEELLSAVERAFEKLYFRRASKNGGSESYLPQIPGLIGESKAMKGVFGMIKKASATSATVLISGESGTGKELVARAIHYGSSRAKAPFVTVNCGGIPEGLLESELFGYVKGAFTGAIASRAGFFQTASGGTIFLDEISEASLAMQVKLLRVLQNKEICMVGDTKMQKVDVRVLAATNKDLASLVNKGAFRKDLLFRLNVIGIIVPPLREREEDIFLLINYFSHKFSKEQGVKPPNFTESALATLRAYSWPGNVRELENTIQRLIVMNDSGAIDAPDLPAYMRFSINRSLQSHYTLEQVEAEYIKNVLESVKGNKTKAAKILGIDRKTLREKIKKYSIE
ncbi:MAG: sigma-54 dependent transcriptional regulator [Myxococcota bacterium]